jgi:hypothetical protein
LKLRQDHVVVDRRPFVMETDPLRTIFSSGLYLDFNASMVMMGIEMFVTASDVEAEAEAPTEFFANTVKE